MSGVTSAALVALFFMTMLWIYPALQNSEAEPRKEHRLASAPAPVPRTIYSTTTLQGGVGVVIVPRERTEAIRSEGSVATVIGEFDGRVWTLQAGSRLTSAINQRPPRN